MNLPQPAIDGPFTFDNLSIFLLRGRDAFDGSRFLPLDQAMEQKCVVVHETGQVGQLEIENLSDVFDLYVQAGDVVKGGRQDRTLGVDFVLPPKSGRVPVPSFCVESGRWHRREAEEAGSFSSSKSSLSSKKLRMATKMSKCQGEVWEKVAETQSDLNASLDSELCAAASPTSYQLTVEHEDLRKRKEQYLGALGGILEGKADALGFAFAINGEINTADTYGSGVLFRHLWSKLLDAAVLEAIAERPRQAAAPAKPVTKAKVRKWFQDAEETAVLNRQEVPPRVCVETRRGKKSVVFDTCDHGFNDAVLHQNLVAN
jgi:hypothetical protein